MLELYILAAVITLFFALGLNVVISRNPVYSILYLVLFFITGSSLLALFGFDYLALIFVLVYVGAIAVLFLFVIMILDIKIINQSGFDATFLVLVSFLLFFFPLFYWVGNVLVVVYWFFQDILSNLPIWGTLGNYTDILLLSPEMSFILKEKGLYTLLFELKNNHLDEFEILILRNELFLLYKSGILDLLIFLKFSFCEYGFHAPITENLLFESNNLFKVDYDSSIKNFQILYTDFTALFLISGGVLLVAMTSCISLALPSQQQQILGREPIKRFKRV